MGSLSYTFMRCSLLLLRTKNTNDKWTNEMVTVIDTLDLSPSILAIALILLHKYEKNNVNSIDNSEFDTLHYYLIIASLVLANKFVNDQSYTLKTWSSILNKCSSFDLPLKMLNQLELNFLAALDYVINTKHDKSLWSLFVGFDLSHVARLQSTVDDECRVARKRSRLEPLVPSPHGLATPPLNGHASTSPINFTNSSTPMFGPMTPISLPACMNGSTPTAFSRLYPSPILQFTPSHNFAAGMSIGSTAGFGAGLDAEGSFDCGTKRRRVGYGPSCGLGIGYMPRMAFTTDYWA